MEPALLNNSIVFVSSVPFLFLKPKIGNIVAFRQNKKIFIKRIIKINPSADGEKYFLKGDNEIDSLDSRKFGWINKKDIVGKIIWSFGL